MAGSTLTQKRRVHGAYDRYGYTIYLNGRPFYSAGNHPGDSAGILDPEAGLAVALWILRRYCRSTAKEIAAEKKAEYQGIYHHNGTDGNRNRVRRVKRTGAELAWLYNKAMSRSEP